MRRLLSKLGLGRALYVLFFGPVGRLRAWLRTGPITARRIRLGMAEMEAAADRLEPVVASPTGPEDDLPELHFLLGRRFWYQAAFCAHSFCAASGRDVRPVLYSDGSLDAETVARFCRVFPQTRVESLAEIEERIERALPRERYPALRERRDNYVNLRKLTDVHAGRDGWKLVLDADMLFFRRPDFLVDWLAAPERPCQMIDNVESYGYSRPLMEELTGAPLAERVNVGICGFDGGAIDWDRLEHWTARLIEAEGTSYLLEQALVAMLVAGRECAVAPEREYICKPERPAAANPEAILHHYVADSKKIYFLDDWKQFSTAK